MPSISTPSSPLKSASYEVNGKWISSCSDITNIEETEAEHSPIKAARWKALREKRQTIAKFLAKHREEGLHNYVDELRHFAFSRGGLIDDEFRAEIWPVLADNLVSDTDTPVMSPCSSDSDFESALSDVVGFTDDSLNALFKGDAEDEDAIAMLKRHKEWNQVHLDVCRTLARFPPNISDEHRTTLQEDLTPLIVRILSHNPKFHYYQGFHDVCLTLLLVLGKANAYRVGVKLSRDGVFSEYLLKSLEDSVVKDLDLVYVILSRTDPTLEKVMRGVQLGSMFALSWPLTWFSHCLHNYHQIVRCFDMFFAAHPLSPVYVTAALVMYRRSAVLAAEREMPFLHHCLNNVPHELPIDELLSDAGYLLKLMPPCLLRGRFLEEYTQKVKERPVRHQAAIPRYTLQLVVLGVAGAAAGYLFMNKFHF